jgi:hypothetical protein
MTTPWQQTANRQTKKRKIGGTIFPSGFSSRHDSRFLAAPPNREKG